MVVTAATCLELRSAAVQVAGIASEVILARRTAAVRSARRSVVPRPATTQPRQFAAVMMDSIVPRITTV